MSTSAPRPNEAERLEELWAGDFGDSYTERNRNAYDARGFFWARLLNTYRVHRVLEVGCNAGGNLVHIQNHETAPVCVGVDINREALGALRDRVPAASGVMCSARSLPFVAGTFDLVITVGVLIHQPDESLQEVMGEVVRCSSKYILCAEYEAEVKTPIAYRGAPRSLFKRPYARLYEEFFPGLKSAARGTLTEKDGFDDVTWTLFRTGPD